MSIFCLTVPIYILHLVGPIHLIISLIHFFRWQTGMKSFPLGSCFLKVAHSHCLDFLRAFGGVSFSQQLPYLCKAPDLLSTSSVAFSHPFSTSSDPSAFDTVDPALFQAIHFSLWLPGDPFNLQKSPTLNIWWPLFLIFPILGFGEVISYPTSAQWC